MRVRAHPVRQPGSNAGPVVMVMPVLVPMVMTGLMVVVMTATVAALLVHSAQHA
jgi:hypothetical protein